jgi:hypothetical protein
MAEEHGNSFSRLSRRWQRKSDPGSAQAVGPNGRWVIKTAPMGLNNDNTSLPPSRLHIHASDAHS